MSITAYVGLPGAGKSYGVVEHQILPALRAGRHVVTNIPLHADAIRKDISTGTIDVFPLDVVLAEPRRISEFAVPGCVLVIDELWRLFPAGVQANKVPESYKSLLAEHRHMVNAAGDSMQIVFVTQDLGQVAAFARQLVEQTFRITKLSHVGMSGRYRVDVYHGVVTGHAPPVAKRLREMTGRYRKEVYQYYQSHTLTEAGGSGANEKAVDKRANVWRSPMWWLGGPVVLGLGIFGVSSAVGYFGGRSSKPVAGVVSSAGPVAVSMRVGRVAGVVETGDGDSTVVLELDGVQRMVPYGAARCALSSLGGVVCEWEGRSYREGWAVRPVARSMGPQAVGADYVR